MGETDPQSLLKKDSQYKSAREAVEIFRSQLGTPRGPERFILDPNNSSTYMDRLLKVGKVRLKIDQITLPTLGKHHRAVSEELKKIEEQAKKPATLQEKRFMVNILPRGIMVEGTAMPLPPKELAIIRTLAEEEEPITGTELSERALGKRDTRQSSLAQHIHSLRKKIGRATGSNDHFLIYTTPEKPPRYYLGDSEVYRFDTKGAPEPKITTSSILPADSKETDVNNNLNAKPKEPNEWSPVPSQSLSIINCIIDNPTISSEDLIEAYGNTQAGEPFSWPVAVSAFRNAVRYLKRKAAEVDSGKLKLNQEESETWQKLQQFLEKNQLDSTEDFVTWGLDKIRPKPAQEKVPERRSALTVEEAAILVSVLNAKKDVLAAKGIEPLGKVIVEGIMDSLDQQVISMLQGLSPEERSRILNSKRKEVLNKVIEIIKSDMLNEIYDQIDNERVQDILVYFTYSDPKKILEVLESEMESPSPSSWHVSKQLVVIGRATPRKDSITSSKDKSPAVKVTVIRDEEQKPVVPEVEPDQPAPPEEEDRQDDQPQAVQGPLIYTPDSLRPRTYELETRVPDIRDRIKQALKLLAMKKITEPVAASYPGKNFSGVTNNQLDKVVKKGIVTLARNRSGKPLLDIPDLIKLLILKDLNVSINPRQLRKELDKLVAEVQLEEAQAKTNGKH